MANPIPRPLSKPAQVKSTTTTTTPTIIVPKFPDVVFTGEVSPSIIHSDLEHLILVTGFRGMGKTSFGLKIDNPNNICVITSEGKTGGLAKPLGVGAYFSVVDEVIETLGDKFDLQAIYDRTLQIVESIPKGRFTTLFLDNASDLQDGCAQYIKNNPSIAQRYGVRPENASTGAYGGAWPGVKHLIKNLIHLARSKGIKVIVVSFQLKGAWKDGKPLFNKFKTTDVSTWHEESNLTLVLVEPMAEYMPIPRALVLKEQLSKLVWDESQNKTIQIRRLPFALPKADPSEIYKYLDFPVDFDNLVKGEAVDVMELSPFTPTFGKEQLIMLERLVRAQKELGLNETTSEESS